MIRALPCTDVVITPACDPVKERALAPRASIAIATSALEMRSPEVKSMSSSRGGGTGETCVARSSRLSVVSPMAETTTTTSFPALRVATMRSATRLIRSALSTDEPPYFCTISATVAAHLSDMRVPTTATLGGFPEVSQQDDHRAVSRPPDRHRPPPILPVQRWPGFTV